MPATSGGCRTSISTRGRPLWSSPPVTWKARDSWQERRIVRKAPSPPGVSRSSRPLSKCTVTSSGTTPSARTRIGTSVPRATRTCTRSGPVSMRARSATRGTETNRCVRWGQCAAPPNKRFRKMAVCPGQTTARSAATRAAPAPRAKRRAGARASTTPATSRSLAVASARSRTRSTSTGEPSGCSCSCTALTSNWCSSGCERSYRAASPAGPGRRARGRSSSRHRT